MRWVRLALCAVVLLQLVVALPMTGIGDDALSTGTAPYFTLTGGAGTTRLVKRAAEGSKLKKAWNSIFSKKKAPRPSAPRPSVSHSPPSEGPSGPWTHARDFQSGLLTPPGGQREFWATAHGSHSGLLTPPGEQRGSWETAHGSHSGLLTPPGGQRESRATAHDFPPTPLSPPSSHASSLTASPVSQAGSHREDTGSPRFDSTPDNPHVHASELGPDEDYHVLVDPRRNSWARSSSQGSGSGSSTDLGTHHEIQAASPAPGKKKKGVTFSNPLVLSESPSPHSHEFTTSVPAQPKTKEKKTFEDHLSFWSRKKSGSPVPSQQASDSPHSHQVDTSALPQPETKNTKSLFDRLSPWRNKNPPDASSVRGKGHVVASSSGERDRMPLFKHFDKSDKPWQGPRPVRTTLQDLFDQSPPPSTGSLVASSSASSAKGKAVQGSRPFQHPPPLADKPLQRSKSLPSRVNYDLPDPPRLFNPTKHFHKTQSQPVTKGDYASIELRPSDRLFSPEIRGTKPDSRWAQGRTLTRDGSGPPPEMWEHHDSKRWPEDGSPAVETQHQSSQDHVHSLSEIEHDRSQRSPPEHGHSSTEIEHDGSQPSSPGRTSPQRKSHEITTSSGRVHRRPQGSLSPEQAHRGPRSSPSPEQGKTKPTLWQKMKKGISESWSSLKSKLPWSSSKSTKTQPSPRQETLPQASHLSGESSSHPPSWTRAERQRQANVKKKKRVPKNFFREKSELKTLGIEKHGSMSPRLTEKNPRPVIEDPKPPSLARSKSDAGMYVDKHVILAHRPSTKQQGDLLDSMKAFGTIMPLVKERRPDVTQLKKQVDGLFADDMKRTIANIDVLAKNDPKIPMPGLKNPKERYASKDESGRSALTHKWEHVMKKSPLSGSRGRGRQQHAAEASTSTQHAP